MTASVTYLRPRKPSRRQGALPAVPARRGLIEETAAVLTAGGYTADYARSLGLELGFAPATTSALAAAMTDAGVAAVLEASRR
jgi:hypothetical protein